MGSGSGSPTLRAGHTFTENLPLLRREYPLSNTGYFGRKSKKNPYVRLIETDDPVRSAYRFQSLAGSTPVTFNKIKGKGHTMVMRDGTRITYRMISSSPDRSPVVELRIVGAVGVKSQKIHFVFRRHS